MIIIKVELHSAITGEVTEIGRMHIVNDASGTKDRGNYYAHIMRRGTTNRVQKTGVVTNWPRLSKSVWHLVSKALESCLNSKKEELTNG